MSVRLKPFFCYYGGKWRAAPRYPAPEHNTIIEPFAGAAGYATCYPDRKVVLVEKDPMIAGLWRYLTHVTPKEIMSIPAEVPGMVDDLAICEEARWLVGFWCNKGTASPCKSASKWMRSGTRPNSFWGSTIRERIALQVEAIQHWQVIEGSYDQAPDVPATWFVDPPYQDMGKYYRHRKVDYEQLATWCKTREGQVMVCEQQGAGWLPFKPFATIRATPGTHGRSFSTEVLWTNSKGLQVPSDVGLGSPLATSLSALHLFQPETVNSIG